MLEAAFNVRSLGAVVHQRRRDCSAHARRRVSRAVTRLLRTCALPPLRSEVFCRV